MSKRRDGQDVLRCHLCETPEYTMFCDLCDIRLCKACVEEHLSDDYEIHRVVHYKNRGSTPICPTHPTRICELHCDECDIPICASCVSSGEHEQHKKVDIFKSFAIKKDTIKKDLKEMVNVIYPEYQGIASAIPAQKVNLTETSQIVKKDIDKYGEALHGEIDIFIDKMKSNLDNSNKECLSALDAQEYQIAHSVSEIKQIIDNLQNLSGSQNIYSVSSYKSRNVEFRALPPELIISLPSFEPSEINTQLICQQIGSLFVSSFEDREREYTMKCMGFTYPGPIKKKGKVKSLMPMSSNPTGKARAYPVNRQSASSYDKSYLMRRSNTFPDTTDDST